MQETTPGFGALVGHQYMNLVTFRKTGAAVSTPVWFAEDSGRLYVMTLVSAGKVKRIRANPQVRVGPSDQRGRPLGPEIAAMAALLPPERAGYADALLTRKYGWMKRLFDLFGAVTGSGGRRAFLEIAPAEERP